MFLWIGVVIVELLFFDALKDGFFHCCVIVFSISDDYIVAVGGTDQISLRLKRIVVG